MPKELLPIDPSTVIRGYVCDHRPEWRNMVFSPIAKDWDGGWCISPFYIRTQVLGKSAIEEGIDKIIPTQEVRDRLTMLKMRDSANRYILGVAARVLDWAGYELEFMPNSLGIWEPIKPGCDVEILTTTKEGRLSTVVVKATTF